ncbi:MAG: efflux transporter periplasmic adaptor subunit, partial [Candidatus Omnitrophica bacterium]|nr:efflux transporter periplasmic adaptor subunit [Candidatus Omnitrophota bacterium]
CNIVFVKKSNLLYQPRKIRVGYSTDENYVVEAGLFPGERIVTTGSYLLKTEILKGSIGAGCTCGG